MTSEEKRANYETDVLIATTLLHDILEDVDWITKEYLIEKYDEYLFKQIDNVTKRDGEKNKSYSERILSDRISAIVKNFKIDME